MFAVSRCDRCDLYVQETSFLSLFLPRLPYIGEQWAASELPLPIVAFSLRWLAFRVMLGFGKQKFIGHRMADWDYMRGFTSSAPLPSRAGYYLFFAPIPIHLICLASMFVIEIILPFGFLLPGIARPAAGLSVMFLMVGIHLNGNWGTVMCVVA